MSLDPRLMTAAERAQGRFLRGPDHDAGTGGGEGGGAEGGDDAATGGDQGGDDGKAGDSGADGAGEEGTDKGADGGDDASLMGKAGDEGDSKDGDDGKGDEAQLPEKYELAAPEGLEITDDVLAEVDPVFRELGLNNDQANKVIALAGPFAQRIQQAAVDQHLATATQWAKDAKADPDIGKGNWSETESLVAKALDRFVGPKVVKDADGNEKPNAFRALLDESKLGNHPEMIRAFRNIGRAISEDTDFARTDAGAQEKTDRLAVLYPDDVPKEKQSA